MDAKKLPQGFIFEPSDKQLLEKYLRPKLQGNKLPWDIKEKEIYGPSANPWEVFNDSSTTWIISGNQKIVYVFARLTKISSKESSGGKINEHYVRKAGCGTWHVETGRKRIMEGTNLIGEKRMLVFQINDLSDGVGMNEGSYWNMHEYFLHGYEDYVLCRITFDPLKKAKVGTKPVSGKTMSSKAKKEIAVTCTTEYERKKVLFQDL